jgi:hypothetical protein
MSRRSRSRYVRGHGYIRYVNKNIDPINGDGIGDIFSAIFKSGKQILTKIPNQLIDVSKKALLDVGSSTIKAVGSRVGDTIADKITKKNIEPSKTPDQELRKQILKELTFDQPINTNEVSNFNHKEPILTSNTNNTNTTGISAEQYNKFYGSGNKRSRKKPVTSKNKRGESIIGSGMKIL